MTRILTLLMKRKRESDFVTIFAGSKANGAAYQEPPRYPIQWPTETWLAQRLEGQRNERRQK